MIIKHISQLLHGARSQGPDFKAYIAAVQFERTSPQFEKLVELKFWVSRLADDEAGLLAEEAAQMCAGFGFPLRWCRAIPTHQDMRPAEREMYFLACLALHEAWKSKPFLKLLSCLNKPNDRAANEFLEQLFMLLLESGFIAFPGELLFVSQARRRRIIRTIIKRAMYEAGGLLAVLLHEMEVLRRHKITVR